jgi:trehalose utilization protein
MSHIRQMDLHLTAMKRITTLILFSLMLLPFSVQGAVRVVVWDEQEPDQKPAYPDFLGNQIAKYLRSKPGFEVKSVRLDDPDFGLSKDTLDHCDVLIWWGHERNDEVPRSKGQEIVDRILQGRLSLIALHSAHRSTPFMMAMEARTVQDARATLPEGQRWQAVVKWTGPFDRSDVKPDDPLTPSFTVERSPTGTVILKIVRPKSAFPDCCSRATEGKASHIRVLLPNHPIARGLPKQFTISHTEMYAEPFHVPRPDAVVFDEEFADGGVFRSGMVWQVGRGKVFYFRPGHEEYDVYSQPYPLRVIENAARWLGGERTKQ